MYTSTRNAAAGLAFVGSLMLESAAVAEPSVQLITGLTKLQLSAELLHGLTSLGVTPDNVLPGGLEPTDQAVRAVLPIPTGELDGAGPEEPEVKGDPASGLAFASKEQNPR